MKLSRQFTLNLAKLMIAAAWKDGTLAVDEINAMKDLVFKSVSLTEDQWAELNIYMDSPVTERETEGLIEAVISEVHTEREKSFVLSKIRAVVESDGVVTEEESDLLFRLEKVMGQKGPAPVALLSDLFKNTIGRRKQKVNDMLEREHSLDDYIKNRVYGRIQLEQKHGRFGHDELPDDDTLRKLSLAAGLMGIVAVTDLELTENEKSAIVRGLESHWLLTHSQAELVADLSCDSAMKGLDTSRLARMFYENTSREERKQFLKILFDVAFCEEKDTSREVEKIRIISNYFKLNHNEFIEAKLASRHSGK